MMEFKAWDGNSIIHVRKLELVPAWHSITGKKGYNINDHLGIPEENLMIFTGEKDKHNKKIFTGHLCKTFKLLDNIEGKVIWDNINLTYTLLPEGWHSGEQLHLIRGHLEIIGNIFEGKK